MANASSVRAYPKLIHYNKLEKGGHFAAWEQPQTIDNKIEKSFELNGGLFGTRGGVVAVAATVVDRLRLRSGQAFYFF